MAFGRGGFTMASLHTSITSLPAVFAAAALAAAFAFTTKAFAFAAAAFALADDILGTSTDPHTC